MPAVLENLIEETVRDIEGRDFHLSIGGHADEDTASLGLTFVIKDMEDTILVTADLTGRVTNPLEFDVKIAGAASDFAICVAVGAVGLAGRIAYQCYAASKEAKPDLEPGPRCTEIFSRMKDRLDDLKTGAVETLKGCGQKAAMGMVG